MSKFSRRAKIVVAGAVVLTAVGGGVAFAFWSTTGTGTGTGSTSGGVSSLTIAQTAAPTDLAPGVAAEAVSGTVTNNATNNAFVNTVTVSIATVTKASGAVGTCDATDYVLTNPVITISKDLTPAQTVAFSGTTLGFNDKATTNQDGCKGATVNLAYATN